MPSTDLALADAGEDDGGGTWGAWVQAVRRELPSLDPHSFNFQVFDSFPKSHITRLPIVPLQPPL